ncbi:hypothetical protein O181_010086 [Austropuccinia psidii MF-1]|uniref:Uncharacterized protein n=1 Tax=Austropuccinia psidii MF-1 TaxID=1389203 RepID=A0A9Q3BQD6_9BASI|nr:hypothetical protein [Austropuccinia psidii MF-1]
MAPTRSERNYSTQPNGSGPGPSSHISKRQEFQARGEELTEDAKASTSFKRLVSTIDNIIENHEAEITAIPSVRSEQIPGSRSINMPISVQ